MVITSNICIKCNKIIDRENKQCKLLGMGSYSNIYNICNSDKIIKKFYEDNRELEICNTINSINKDYFIKYYQKIDKNIIYQKIDGYTLDSYIMILCPSTNDRIDIFIKLFNILLDLENSGYNHLDISPNNIMIEKETKKIYIIDYNYITNDINIEYDNCGSYYYIPPEFLNNKKIIFNKFDIFSFCVIMVEYILNITYHKTNNYNKTCTCSKNCDNLQYCINNIISKYIDKIKNNSVIKKILDNGYILDYNKRKSFKEISQLIKQ